MQIGKPFPEFTHLVLYLGKGLISEHTVHEVH